MINRLNNNLLNHHEIAFLLKQFLVEQLIGVSSLLVVTYFFPDSLWLCVYGFVATTAAMGDTLPSSSACFMQYFGKKAGVAAATFGAVQYSVGAAVSTLAAVLSSDSFWPIVLVMATSTLIALLGAFYRPQARAQTELSSPSGAY